MEELYFGLKEYFEKESQFWFEENMKHILERDSFRKQRDELINDMAEVKRKAEAFDEIVNAIEESANSYELVARIKLEVLKYQKLERGSDVQS